MTHYYGTPGLTYGSGIHYGSGSNLGGKVNIEIAYNIDTLEPRPQVQKIQNARDAVADNASTFTTPNPTLASVQTAIDDAGGVLDDIDALDEQRKTLVLNRDAKLAAAIAKYKALGTYVQGVAMA